MPGPVGLSLRRLAVKVATDGYPEGGDSRIHSQRPRLAQNDSEIRDQTASELAVKVIQARIGNPVYLDMLGSAVELHTI